MHCLYLLSQENNWYQQQAFTFYFTNSESPEVTLKKTMCNCDKTIKTHVLTILWAQVSSVECIPFAVPQTSKNQLDNISSVLVRVLLLWRDTVTKKTLIKKCLIGASLHFRALVSYHGWEASQHAGRCGADEVGQSSTSGSEGNGKSEPLGMAWASETSSPPPVAHFLQQSHTYSNKV